MSDASTVVKVDRLLKYTSLFFVFERSGTMYNRVKIMIEDEQVERVYEFVYSESMFTRNCI